MTLDGAIAWCLAIASKYEDEDGDKTAQLLQKQGAEIARLRAEVERLRDRCMPSRILMLGDRGHYVSEAVAEAFAARDRVIEAAFRALDAARTWEFATGREPDLDGILDLYRDSEAEARRLRAKLLSAPEPWLDTKKIMVSDGTRDVTLHGEKYVNWYKELREAREALGTWLHDSIEKERTNDANP